MYKLREKLHSSQGRIVAGVAMMAALVNGLGPDTSRPFDFEKAATVALAAMVWLFAEIGNQVTASESDINLYKRAKAIMDDAALSFLRHHDFGGSLRDSQTSAVGVICSWHGADAEFLDPKVQIVWQSFRLKLEALNRLYAEKLGPSANPDRLSAVPPEIDEWNLPNHVSDAIVALNEGASQAYEAFNSFDRVARKRLNL